MTPIVLLAGLLAPLFPFQPTCLQVGTSSDGTDVQEGFIDLKRDTTIRTYLANQLHCPAMRISKKFHGSAAMGLVRFPANRFVTAFVPHRDRL